MLKQMYDKADKTKLISFILREIFHYKNNRSWNNGTVYVYICLLKKSSNRNQRREKEKDIWLLIITHFFSCQTSC
jgi:hypothetical protein